MVSDLGEMIFVAGYAFIIATAVIQYRREHLSYQYVLAITGGSLIWLSYGILEITDGDPVSLNPPLSHIAEGFALILLLSGLYIIYRWWKLRSDEDSAKSTNEPT